MGAILEPNPDIAGQAPEWRRGWTVVFAGFFGLAASVTYIYSLGTLFEPLQAEFGWGRGEISLGLAFVSAVAVISNPGIGLLLGRLSARQVLLPSLVAYTLALGGLAFVGPSIWSWWLGWILIALTVSGLNISVWAYGVASRFEGRRGLALGLTLSGLAFGSAVIPSLTLLLVDQFGWRGAYLSLAGLVLLAGLLPTMLLFFDASDERRRRSHKGPDHAEWRPQGLTMAQVLRSPSFWRMAPAVLLTTTGIVAISVHFIPLTTGNGLSRESAVAMAGIIGLAGVAGRLLTGYLLDHLPARLLACAACAIPLVGSLQAIWFDGSPASAALIAAAIGFGLGAEGDVAAYLTSRYFGLRRFGGAYGIIIALSTIGAGCGPFLAGAMFDRMQSYDVLLWCLSGAFLLSAALMATLGPYPAAFSPKKRAAEAVPSRVGGKLPV